MGTGNRLFQGGGGHLPDPPTQKLPACIGRGGGCARLSHYASWLLLPGVHTGLRFIVCDASAKGCSPHATHIGHCTKLTKLSVTGGLQTCTHTHKHTHAHNCPSQSSDSFLLKTESSRQHCKTIPTTTSIAGFLAVQSVPIHIHSGLFGSAKCPHAHT